ncbi:MAG: M20/M25/M40 family metallo-hydrolase, partial [Acidimicrobiales bacterium]
TLADAMAAAAADPDALGPDPERLAALFAFVELHVEQGRQLGPIGASVGVATHIWPHGRWHLRFCGEANHGGTTVLGDRRDPMLAFAESVAAARAAAGAHGGLTTVGRAIVTPNATNAVASSVDAWLDARAPDETALGAIVADVRVRASAASAEHGVGIEVEKESLSPAVRFDGELRSRMGRVLRGAPEIGTGAGHDAGVLAAAVPSGMLFVRNPTGVSHSPAEHASLEDCLAGVDALSAVLEDLVWH